jgi:hypothetical protein
MLLLVWNSCFPSIWMLHIDARFQVGCGDPYIPVPVGEEPRPHWNVVTALLLMLSATVAVTLRLRLTLSYRRTRRCPIEMQLRMSSVSFICRMR